MVERAEGAVPGGEPWKWGAVETAAAVRAGQVSAREVADSVLGRIDQINPAVNALPYVLGDEARRLADEVDRRRAAGEPLGLLAGVPVTTKLNSDHAGWPTTNGLQILKDNVQSADSAVVGNLRAADSVFVGRSNVPAFSIRWFSENDLHGRTLNPWNRGRTPGGSSGGAAAAVACGMGAIAQGNDMGGSIRYPAYACGVVGLRPSAGRVPFYKPSLRGGLPLTAQLMSVQGPLARSVADVELAFEAMCAPDFRDPLQVPWSQHGPVLPAKVALFDECPGVAAHSTVRESLRRAATALEQAGYRVEPVAPPGYVEATHLWRSILHNDLRPELPFIEQHGDRAIGINLAHMFAGIEDLDRAGYLAEMARRNEILSELALFFHDYPVLLMPTSWEPVLEIDADIVSRERFEEVMVAQGPVIFGAGMALPGLSVPTGLTDGLPTGVQLVGAPYTEDTLFRAGRVIESAFGRLTPIDPITSSGADSSGGR